MIEAPNTMIGKSVLVTLNQWIRFPDGKQYDCIYGVISEWGDVWAKVHDVYVKQQDIASLIECDGVEFKFSVDRIEDEETKEVRHVRSLPRIAMAAVPKKGLTHE